MKQLVILGITALFGMSACAHTISLSSDINATIPPVYKDSESKNSVFVEIEDKKINLIDYGDENSVIQVNRISSDNLYFQLLDQSSEIFPTSKIYSYSLKSGSVDEIQNLDINGQNRIWDVAQLNGNLYSVQVWQCH